LAREGSGIDQEVNAAKQKLLIRAEPSIALKQDMVQVDEVCRQKANIESMECGTLEEVLHVILMYSQSLLIKEQIHLFHQLIDVVQSSSI
jgi:H2-forming N5,N10-methylenetetrahydromethanopterin dehydrogenase-like enzyme